MKYLEQFKDISYAGNTGYDYIIALAIFVGLIILLKIIKVVIVGRLRQLAKKSKNDFDDTIIEIFGKVKPPFYFFIALYFSIRALDLSAFITEIVTVLFLIIIVYEVVNALSKVSDYFMAKYLSGAVAGGSNHSKAMIRAVNMIIKAVLWLLGITLILANLGVNVTSLVASLGIGGLAIALALQKILSDIFSSFSIYIDKPFLIGDYIVIGNDSGTVEKIGLKTTRIKTTQGQELIISNNELTSARVENYKKMEKRRVVLPLGVTYDTKQEKIEKVPVLIKGVIDGVSGAEFGRCHFKTYGDWALNFETIFYVNSGDYNEYMDVNQEVNLKIFKAFAKEKIDFAYPTQTVFVQK